MFRLVHISDPHLGPLPAVTPLDLMSKRILGYLNWRRNRAHALRDDLAARLVSAVAALAPDHVAVTGDLANLGLAAEFPRGLAFLDGLGPGDAVTVVPGNHDAYVPGAVRRAIAVWHEHAKGDAGAAGDWPIVRKRGDVAIIGLSTAVATGPFMATGRLGADQASRLGDILARLGDAHMCRVLLIHHQPVAHATAWHKRLTDSGRFSRLIAEHGAELILHGHTHLPTRLSLAGPGGTGVPVIGVPASTQSPGGHRPASGFNVIDIDAAAGGWRIEVALRQYDPVGDDYVETRRDGYGTVGRG